MTPQHIRNTEEYKAFHGRARLRRIERNRFHWLYFIPGTLGAIYNYDGRTSSLYGSLFVLFAFTMATWELVIGARSWMFWHRVDRYSPKDPRRGRAMQKHYPREMPDSLRELEPKS